MTPDAEFPFHSWSETAPGRPLTRGSHVRPRLALCASVRPLPSPGRRVQSGLPAQGGCHLLQVACRIHGTLLRQSRVLRGQDGWSAPGSDWTHRRRGSGPGPAARPAGARGPHFLLPVSALLSLVARFPRFLSWGSVRARSSRLCPRGNQVSNSQANMGLTHRSGDKKKKKRLTLLVSELGATEDILVCLQGSIFRILMTQKNEETAGGFRFLPAT